MTLQLQKFDRTRTYTNAEFEAIPEFDGRFELLDGKVVEKMPNGDRHGRIGHRLERLITLFDPDEKLGIVWRETSFSLANDWEPMPDLAFVVAARVPAETSTALEVVPDLAVEVFSPHDLDLKNRLLEAQAKLVKYLAVGVPIVWSINPDQKSVAVYYPGQDTPVRTLTVNDTLEGEAVIPGFSIQVSQLFE